MKSIGDILKKTREGKNISLSSVSKELKISEEVLSNLENNYLQKDIDIVSSEIFNSLETLESDIFLSSLVFFKISPTNSIFKLFSINYKPHEEI